MKPLSPLFLLLLLGCYGLANADSWITKTPWTGPNKQFVTCIQPDRDGWWWGTEDDGLWRYNSSEPAGSRWHHYRGCDGLADDTVYALCIDHQGRLWAGTNRSGVSVYNGADWKNFDQTNGPLGCHIVALAVCPADGDVWMATEAGLARYSDSKKTWSYFTRAEGLPSDQATSLAFTENGDIFVGTSCDGIAIARAADGYAKWTVVPGSPFGTITTNGDGLPSSQINCLLVSKTGRIWAGTHDGLAHSDDGGVTWSNVRGYDYSDKVAGAYYGGIGVGEATVCAVQLRPAPGVVGNPGGQTADGSWFSGGDVVHADAKVDTTGVAGAIDASMYQTSRVGRFELRVPGLVPISHYQMRLHFAETTVNAKGKREFDVWSFNGGTVNGMLLSQFDIYGAVGADKALVKSFDVTTDAFGTLNFWFGGRPPVGVPPHPNDLLEDYCTSLAEDPGGDRLYIGHWRRGYEIWNSATGKRLYPTSEITVTDFVTALAPATSGMLVAGYGNGLRMESTAVDPMPTVPNAPALRTGTAFPEPATPLLPDHLMTLGAHMLSARRNMAPGDCAFLGEDWQTEGDWVGRYGREYCVMCAAGSPFDHEFAIDPSCRISGYVGPHHDPSDELRRWLQWLTTDDRRVL